MRNALLPTFLSLGLLIGTIQSLHAEWHVGDPVVLRPDSTARPLEDDSVARSSHTPVEWNLDRTEMQPDPKVDRWWESFGDTTLRSLIDRGADANYNLLAAYKRIEAARSVLRQTQAGYFPQLSASAAYARQGTAGKSIGADVASTQSNLFSLGLSMSWEIDVFGRIAAQAKVDKANIKASAADYDAVMVSLASNIAQTYLSLRMYQAELDVALRHLDSQREILKIAETRFECGLVSKLDVVQARMVVNSTLSTLPGLYALIDSSVNSLALLLATTPDQLEFLRIPSPLPELPVVGPAELNINLLRRRPDVAEAEQQLAAIAAQLGVAKKDFLPTLSLTGSIATEGQRAGDLFGSRSLAYSVAPTLSWTIFDGLARNYRVAEARANLEAETESYNLTLHTAFREAANALASFNAACIEADLDSRVAADSEEALELSVDRYRQGLSDFTNVVDAQMSYLEYQNSSIVAKGKALNSLVSLYAAMGGGWDGE
ncbi:MAG: efflux transporter outer membrane subunit [Bacteroides sp.]|nr:efflux transporter outer membrane subunit [Bacteroides sp.]